MVIMPTIHPTSPSAKITRGHSCLSCQQRKVRCDGRRPCSSCTKSGGECISAKVSTASRRRDVGSGIISNRLLARLKRCEELLQAHGTKIEEDCAAGESDGIKLAAASASKVTGGQMILEHGHSRYIEKYGSSPS